MKSAFKSIRPAASRFLCAVLIVSVLMASMLLPCYASAEEQMFIESVNALRDCDAGDWEEALEKAEECFNAIPGGIDLEDASDELVAAYGYYNAEMEMFNACARFLECVDSFDQQQDYDSFSEISPIMEDGNDILTKYSDENKFRIYTTSSAISKFKEQYNDYDRDKQNADKFIDNAYLASVAQNYVVAKQKYDMALSYKGILNYDDYPHFQEALENMEIAKNFLNERDAEAIGFITSVQMLADSNDKFSAICTAYEKLKGIDQTVTEAVRSKATLDAHAQAYNEKVEAANAASKGARGLLLGLLP